MRNRRLIFWSTITLFLVVALACAETGSPVSPTPTYPVVQGSPFRGLFPSDVEITPDGTRAYVPCYGSNNVLVIDTTSHEVIDEIDLSRAGPFGLYPIDAVMTPDGKKLYLADDFTGLIGVVDTTTNRATTFVDLAEGWPTGKGNRIAVTPDGRFVYAALESNQVSVIDVATDTVVGIVVLEASAYLVAFSPDSSRAYLVSQPAGGRVYVVDTSTHTVVDRIDLGFEQELQTQASVAVSPDGRELYLTSGFNAGGYEHPEIGLNRVFVIDVTSRSLIDEIKVIGGPHRIHLSPDGRLAYVSTADATTVFALDLVNRVNIGGLDWSSAYQDGFTELKQYVQFFLAADHGGRL